LKEIGKNVLVVKEADPLWRIFLNQFADLSVDEFQYQI